MSDTTFADYISKPHTQVTSLRIAAVRAATFAGMGLAVGVVGGTAINSALKNDRPDRVNEVNAALAAGDEVLKYKNNIFEITCTGTGAANALRIGIDDNGKRALMEPLLPEPGVRAARCKTPAPGG